MNDPVSDYQRRYETAQAEERRLDERSRALGNLRLILALATAFVLWLRFWQGFGSGWLALVPGGVFVALVIWHQAILKQRKMAARRAAFYAEGLARLEDNWTGQGSTGSAFRPKGHVFADDLDVFGDGSLFQMISRARTLTGEETLANWLLRPADPEAVSDRHEAVRELTGLVDLREDIALLGTDVGEAVHPGSLAEWAEAPPVPLPRWLRPVALLLALVNVITLVAYLRSWLPLFPFLIAFLCNSGLLFLVGRSIGKILSSLEAPAHDLDILSLLIERLENEVFQSTPLRRLSTDLHVEQVAVSRQIRRLKRLVELADSMDHVILRVLNPLLLLTQQVAAFVEAWRQANGKYVSTWLRATGEFEALSSMACLSYERPGWRFPQLVDRGRRCYEAKAIRHPLIPQTRSVANNVELGEKTVLLIVSGSNMSGKSTLLRAIGLNAILAWAGGPVCAEELRLSPLQLGASIRVTDSLQDNQSRFYAEITRLRQIVELTKEGPPLLFLLDELLSGTNSHDRRAGATGVIRSLIRQGAFGLITTHDLALAAIADGMNGQAGNVHFEDQMVDSQMQFDYRLREGVVTRSNALALMRAVGLETIQDA